MLIAGRASPRPTTDQRNLLPIQSAGRTRGLLKRTPGSTSRASAMSTRRSYKIPRFPCSTSIRTFLVTPDRKASVSCVMPLASRRVRMLLPTTALACCHFATRSGLFWLGRVGTPPVITLTCGSVCPTSSTFTAWRASRRTICCGRSPTRGAVGSTERPPRLRADGATADAPDSHSATTGRIAGLVVGDHCGAHGHHLGRSGGRHRPGVAPRTAPA